MECLKEKSAKQIFDAQVTGVFKSRPNIDLFASEPILPDDPELLFQSGNFNKVPVIIGTNSGEGILNAAEYIKRYTNVNTIIGLC